MFWNLAVLGLRRSGVVGSANDEVGDFVKEFGTLCVRDKSGFRRDTRMYRDIC